MPLESLLMILGSVFGGTVAVVWFIAWQMGSMKTLLSEHIAHTDGKMGDHEARIRTLEQSKRAPAEASAS